MRFVNNAVTDNSAMQIGSMDESNCIDNSYGSVAPGHVAQANNMSAGSGSSADWEEWEMAKRSERDPGQLGLATTFSMAETERKRKRKGRKRKRKRKRRGERKGWEGRKR